MLPSTRIRTKVFLSFLLACDTRERSAQSSTCSPPATTSKVTITGRIPSLRNEDQPVDQASAQFVHPPLTSARKYAAVFSCKLGTA